MESGARAAMGAWVEVAEVAEVAEEEAAAAEKKAAAAVESRSRQHGTRSKETLDRSETVARHTRLRMREDARHGVCHQVGRQQFRQ